MKRITYENVKLLKIVLILPKAIKRGAQVCVGMDMRTRLADSAHDLGDNTTTRIFNSVRQFYVPIIEKLVRIFFISRHVYH